MDIINSPDTRRPNRVPPGQHTTDNWPVLHEGDIPQIDTATWSFHISGLVDKAKTLSFNEFTALPRTKVASDIHCVTGWSKLNNLWAGVSAGELKKLVDIKPDARFVIVYGCIGPDPRGFTANLSVADFFTEDVVFALNYNDKPLTPEHGGPVRLIVPQLYFWKSAKWVSGVEFTADDRPGYWESRGYHNHGNPWTEERRSR